MSKHKYNILHVCRAETYRIFNKQESLRLKLLPKLWPVNLHQCLQPELLALFFFYYFNLTFNFMMHDITVCFAGLYCGLFLYLVEVKESGRNVWIAGGADASTDKKIFSQKKRCGVSCYWGKQWGCLLKPPWFTHGTSWWVFYSCWTLNMPGGKSKK